MITARTGRVDARVEDDGVGFHVARTLLDGAQRGRLGLVGSSERVRLLGGRFDVRSQPGGPTTVSLSLPRWLTLALAAAAAATLLGGVWRFLGINVIIALSVPFCLGGLAVLHAAVRRLANPAVALVAFYTLAGLFGWPLLAAAILGLFESWLGLRRRLAPHGVSIDG